MWDFVEGFCEIKILYIKRRNSVRPSVRGVKSWELFGKILLFGHDFSVRRDRAASDFGPKEGF
jgi:hypothetical protein